MRRRAIGIMVLAIAVASSACGSGISASNCDELEDETVKLLQRMIDYVDAEVGDRPLDSFESSAEALPPLDDYAEESAQIDELGEELGCDPDLTKQAVSDRASELTADTEIGRFIIQSVRLGLF